MPIFAAAQYSAVAGDLRENLRRHLAFMHAAHRHGAGFLLFPELSLTGYELTLAQALAQPADTSLIAPLRALAREARMTTVVGLPLKLDEGGGKPRIAAFVLQADGSLAIYTKQHLHAGESDHCSAGQGGELLDIGGLQTALCVCADFSQASHAECAAQAGAQLYAASVLVGEGGYATDAAILQEYARQHRMAVLMANHGGPTGGWPAAGRSCFWNGDGKLVAATPGPGEHLLLVSNGGGGWSGEAVAVGIAA